MILYAQAIAGESAAEDIVHNAFLKLINRIDILKELQLDKQRNYIVMTVKTCAFDYFREEKKYVSLEDYEERMDENRPTEIESVLDKEGYEFLKNCIRALDDTYREICELKYILHMKEREIAKELNLSEKVVNIRIFRGKNMLKRMISERYNND
jgi:RNA polymerase sigma-70 factor (ECF subfamily)